MAAAESVFQRSLEIEKENPSALSGLSFCRSSQGRYREAADLALEGVSLLFSHFYSHYCYGVALAHLGERQGAIRAFENTLRFQPRFHQARHYLVHLLRHNPAAQPIATQHRSILLQRGIDRIKSDFRRLRLREQLQASRTNRAGARARMRAAAVDRERRSQEQPSLDLLIVSGLPRSGTSLVMQMLSAAGLPIMTDGVRGADEDNPQGYYEWERIKELPKDPHVISETAGRVVKVVSPLLHALPRKHRYKVIFLRRDLDEIIASQNRMRQRLTGSPPDDLAATRLRLEAHFEQIKRLLNDAPNLKWIEIRFEELLSGSEVEIARLAAFCGLSGGTADLMSPVVKRG